jgi:hypothetical protein
MNIAVSNGLGPKAQLQAAKSLQCAMRRDLQQSQRIASMLCLVLDFSYEGELLTRLLVNKYALHFPDFIRLA